MKKTFIVSEEERKNILEQHQSMKKRLVVEQTEVAQGNKAIQCFLNKKSITDNSGQKLEVDGSIGNYPNSKSAQAIFKYQEKIGANADGIWGKNTMDKMSEQDKKMFKQCENEYQDFVDKFLNYIGL